MSFSAAAVQPDQAAALQPDKDHNAKAVPAHGMTSL